jgi:hypothetical protein
MKMNGSLMLQPLYPGEKLLVHVVLEVWVCAIHLDAMAKTKIPAPVKNQTLII